MNNFETLKKAITNFQPANEQESSDKFAALRLINTFGKETLFRTCPVHFTTSVFIFNHDFTKVLLCWHLIDKSWVWLGGHADGNADLMHVIKKEITEESSIPSEKIKFMNDGNIASLTIFAIPGHEKKGKYVTSHTHIDCAFVAYVTDEENLSLTIKPDENNGLKWVDISDIDTTVADRFKAERVFPKFYKFAK